MASPSPSPPTAAPRFGLRGLLAATAFAAGQFALVAYLNVWWGLAAGLALAGLALMALLVAAVIAYPRAPRRVAAWDSWALGLTLLVLALVVALAVAGGGALIAHSAERLWAASYWHTQLGFTHARRDAVENGRGTTVVVVESVSPGGAFDRAGARPGDMLLRPREARELFAEFSKNRGGSVVIEVAPHVAGQPVETAPARTVVVEAPP